MTRTELQADKPWSASLLLVGSLRALGWVLIDSASMITLLLFGGHVVSLWVDCRTVSMANVFKVVRIGVVRGLNASSLEICSRFVLLHFRLFFRHLWLDDIFVF